MTKPKNGPPKKPPPEVPSVGLAVVDPSSPGNKTAIRIENDELFFPYLNYNQNAFLREHIIRDRKDVVGAYRAVYKNNMSDASAKVVAYSILRLPVVRLALNEIEKMAAQELALTLQSHLEELANLRDAAKHHKQFNAAIMAEVARGRAAGLYVQKMEITGKDGAPLGINDVSTEEFKRAREKILNDC